MANHTMQPGISDLPEEILEIILKHVPMYEDLKSCSQVCSHWFHLSKRVFFCKQRLFKHALLSGPLSFSVTPFVLSDSSSRSLNIARHSHSAAVAGNYMYLFGGCSYNTVTTFNDLLKISLNSNKKSRLLTTGQYPSPKAHASMVVHKDRLILLGGWTSHSNLQFAGSLFDELHMYSISENSWTQVHLPFAPPPMAGHSATVHGNVVVVFGGMQNSLATRTPSNKIYCLDLESNEWFEPKVTRERPEPRAGQTQIKIDERHIVILSGCSGVNSRQKDMWLLTLPKMMRAEEWSWKIITMNCTESMPKHLWSYPACKVGDNIVVLANQNIQNEDMLLDSLAQEPRRKIYPPNPRQFIDLKGKEPANEFNHCQFISKPSVRPNACDNREKRLMMLNKYENYFRDKHQVKVIKKRNPSCSMGVYLLDIASILKTSEATWKAGPSWDTISPPHSRVKCTLLLGKGELILCCGTPTEECSCNPLEPVEQLVYIKAPNTIL